MAWNKHQLLPKFFLEIIRSDKTLGMLAGFLSTNIADILSNHKLHELQNVIYANMGRYIIDGKTFLVRELLRCFQFWQVDKEVATQFENWFFLLSFAIPTFPWQKCKTTNHCFPKQFIQQSSVVCWDLLHIQNVRFFMTLFIPHWTGYSFFFFPFFICLNTKLLHFQKLIIPL